MSNPGLVAVPSKELYTRHSIVQTSARTRKDQKTELAQLGQIGPEH